MTGSRRILKVLSGTERRRVRLSSSRPACRTRGELTEDDVKKAAAFNEWGVKIKAAGIQFGYHPHGFEFVHTPTQTLFDVLAAETKPDLVTFELDTFWFAIAGADPAAFLERYPNRFQLLHLKDLAKGAPPNGSGSAPDE